MRLVFGPAASVMMERIWINRVASEIVFQPFHTDAGAPLDEERVVALWGEPSLHFEFLQRGVADGMRSSWKISVDVASRLFRRCFKLLGNSKTLRSL